ncbi:MAG: tyrosine-type recombinase/integrase [Burkholderiaceae bacterium]
MTAIMAGYLEHAATLRSPETARFHALRLGPWAQKYRASQARECAAHIVKDMTTPVAGEDGVAKAPYAPATVNRSLGALKKALSIAWESGSTPENYGLRVKRLPEHNARELFLSIDQVRRIAEHCSLPAQAAIWTALLTGARRGEVYHIERAWIHRDHIQIPASHTKTLRSRAVPIVPALRPWLEHFPLQITLDGVKSAFRRARVKAGMPLVRFHDLRHSCASILIGLGVDLYTVGEILGHSSVQTTKRYAHLQLDRKREALAKLGSLVEPAEPSQEPRWAK